MDEQQYFCHMGNTPISSSSSYSILYEWIFSITYLRFGHFIFSSLPENVENVLSLSFSLLLTHS